MARLDSLQVFFGDASQAEARVYALLADWEATERYKLAGSVTGPTCAYAQTLTAKTTFVERPGGPGRLLEAIVPDPCFWSDSLPFLYRVRIELRSGNDVVEVAEHWLGIRQVGARERRLICEGKSWVIRGASRHAVREASLSKWRATSTAMLVDAPDDELCERASREGTWLLARIPVGTDALIAELLRLSRWPAVVMAHVTGNSLPDQHHFDPGEIRLAARNLLVAQTCDSRGPTVLAPWAQAVVVEADSAEVLAKLAAQFRVPVLARRRSQVASLVEARRHCDELQRDLAGEGDFAGYLV